MSNMSEVKENVKDLLKKAWQVRRTFFPDQVEFVLPNRTLPVTVTGDQCELRCAHCNGSYLQQMTPLEQVLQVGQSSKAETSYLVSGGCTSLGRVPLSERIVDLKELARRGPLNLHTGLVGEDDARLLAQVATVVSFDFVGDDRVINKVYHTRATVQDYLKAYRALNRYITVVPHICIGLDQGRIESEYKTLQILKKEAVEALSLIVFRPTRNTAFAEFSSPEPTDVAAFIAAARLHFPRTPLYLGCMRPGGRYREELDPLALEAGVNKIVIPAPAARRRATALGLTISKSGECCSL